MAETQGTQDMSDAELSLLTPEERAALEDDDEPAVDPTLVGTAEEPVTEDVSAELGDDEPETEAPAPTKAEEAAATAEAAPAKTRRSDDIVLEEGEKRDWDADLAGLAQKFDEGELTTTEFATQQAAIIRSQSKAETAAAINDAMWERAQRRFFNEHQQYKSTVMHAALAAALQEESKAEPGSIDGEELLDRAHKRVSKEFGLKVDGTGSPKGSRPPVDPVAAQAKAAKSAPKTLAEVPAASGGDDEGGGRWAALDNLTGLDLEYALAKLSDADQEKFLAGQL
jgi:hypothetical protein